jgi:hypothetical protein
MNNCIELRSCSLETLFLEARKLCESLDKPFDWSKIVVGTDYGTKVVIAYIEEEDGE